MEFFMTQTELEEASRDELLAYAKDVKGMDLPKQIRTETLRNKLLGNESNEVDAKNKDKTEETQKEKRVKIIIQQSDTDSADVFVGVNGRPYLIQRGEGVEVPEHIVEVLRNAKKTVHTTKVDRQTGETTLEAREVLSYPFSIVG